MGLDLARGEILYKNIGGSLGEGGKKADIPELKHFRHPSLLLHNTAGWTRGQHCSTHTEPEKSLCTWFGEFCYCCCLHLLP